MASCLPCETDESESTRASLVDFAEADVSAGDTMVFTHASWASMV
jgi:hypothetical protein